MEDKKLGYKVKEYHGPVKRYCQTLSLKDNPELIDVEFVKIELYDKIKAIECLNKMLGYNEPERVDVEVRRPMTDEEARAIIERLDIR